MICDEVLELLSLKVTLMDNGRLAIINKLIELDEWDGYNKNICTLTEIPEHFIKKMLVTFDPNKGTCVEKLRYVKKAHEIGSLPSASLDLYVHLGWFLEREAKNLIQSNYVVNNNITCYAGYMKEYMTLERIGSVFVDPSTLIASNFSTSNFLTSITEDLINFSDGLELIFRARSTNPSPNQEIFGMTNAEAFEFGLNANKFMWEIAGGSASTTGSHTCDANKWYYWKVVKAVGAYSYTCYIADGTTITESPSWQLDYGPVTRSATVIGNFALGIDYWGGSATAHVEPWVGEIDVRNSYMKVNGHKITFRVKDLYDDIYYITYILNGGINNASNPLSYKYETPTITLKNPTKDYYDFSSWSPTNTIPLHSFGNKTFTAIWTPKSYSITYTLNGGTNHSSNPSTYTYETPTITLYNPSRSYYDFNNWSSGGIVCNKIPLYSSGNKTFTANWTLHPYSIYYNLAGGSNNPSNPSTYTYETPTITLGNPTYSGKMFAGWSPSNSIPYHSSGNKTFTASWTDPITLIFKVCTFGCTPTIKITINGELKYNAKVSQGENTISITTFAGLAGTLEISDYDTTNTIVYLDGVKKEGFTSLSFITKDGTTDILLFLITKEHSFVGVKDKIHEEQFIYSPGNLIGGFKYKFHWQSIYPESDKSINGKIVIGHVGSDSTHLMHLKFGYKVNDGAVQAVAVNYTNGTKDKIGYYESGTFTAATSATGKTELGAKGLSAARASLQLEDYIIDLTGRPRTDMIQIGIVLKDHSSSCAGIYFGNYKDLKTDTTKCTIDIIEE